LKNKVQIQILPDGRAVALKGGVSEKIFEGFKTTDFRVSHIREENGKFVPDMAPVGGPVLDPCETREEAIKEEVAYINANFDKVAKEALRRHDAGVISE